MIYQANREKAISRFPVTLFSTPQGGIEMNPGLLSFIRHAHPAAEPPAPDREERGG